MFGFDKCNFAFGLSKVLFFKFPTAKGAEPQTKTLKIAFLNKLYSNTNYQPINQKLLKISPDIAGFAEMKQIDIPQIASLSNYPCQISSPARDGATVSLFSKYPCQRKEVPADLPFAIHAQMTILNDNFDVLVIHPYPPQNDQWVKLRDQELADLAKYISALNNPQTLVLGDFNTTPWSPGYRDFVSGVEVVTKDSSKGAGINFTWHTKGLLTQIDHIFVPQRASVSSFHNEYIVGSDHTLIWTQMQF